MLDERLPTVMMYMYLCKHCNGQDDKLTQLYRPGLTKVRVQLLLSQVSKKEREKKKERLERRKEGGQEGKN